MIRLGSSSVPEINKINSHQASELINDQIEIVCRQVPSVVEENVYCFIWLGSDNNKGIPTQWKQGLRAIGKVKSKAGGPSYNDEWTLSIEVGIIFKRSVNKPEILRLAGLDYIAVADMPVIGLNNFSNQTVQLIRDIEEGQNIPTLLTALVRYQNDLAIQIKSVYSDLNISFEDFSSITSQEKDNSEQSVEQTDEGNVAIKIPFDPNLIRIRRDPYTLGELIDRIEYGEINFFTGFQRKADLWDTVKQSRLIESIFLKLPLPAFYFDENEGNKWQVIDGLQRTSAIRNFVVEKSLRLANLEFLKELDDKSYDELPRELLRRINTTPLTVYVVEKGTPDEVKFNIFKRINTGGLILTPQEIRHALNQGVPANFIAELANLDEFREATCYAINPERMEDRDFVTRFVTFYVFPYFQYEPDLDSFMTKGMAELKNTSIEFRNKMKADFSRSMIACITIFGNDAFRKRQNIHDRRKPINKALFETLSVTISQLTLVENERLLNRKEIFRSKFIELNNNGKFLSAISSGTGQPENVAVRFDEIKRITIETIEADDD